MCMYKILKKLIPPILRNKLRNSILHNLYISAFESDKLVYAQNHFIELYGNSDSCTLKSSRIYEQATTYFIRDYLKENDVVYDIGANIGYFSLEFARCVGKHGKVLSFEPHPDIFKVLERNVHRNKYHNIFLNKSACGENKGIQQLFFSTENEGNHKIVANEYSKGSTSVQVIELSSFINKDVPRLIKMDIEGAELLALKGIGNDIIRAHDLDFIIEYHPYEMSFFNSSGKDLLNFLEKFGYKFKDLATIDFPNVSKDHILSKYTKDDYGITNLFCSKSL